MVRGSAFVAACLAAVLSGCESLNKKPAPPPEKPATAEAPPLLEPTPATPPTSERAAAPAAPADPVPEPFVGDQEPLPRESYAPQQAQASRVHVVQRGETLRGLAKRYYKDPNKWRRIYEANRQRISNPNEIRVGMKLIVP